MYMTLKLDDSGCRIHSVSDGGIEIVTPNVHGYALENGYQTWSKRDPQRGG